MIEKHNSGRAMRQKTAGETLSKDAPIAAVEFY